MKKCKICGEFFSYHITNSHLDSHNITRKEYDKIEKKDTLFTFVANKYNQAESDVNNYFFDSYRRASKKR